MPEFQNQRQQDRRGREKYDQNRANIANSIEDNITGNSPNGDPAPKRSSDKKWKSIIIGVGLASTLVQEYWETFKSEDTHTPKDNQSQSKDTSKEDPPKTEKNVILTPLINLLDEQFIWQKKY